MIEKLRCFVALSRLNGRGCILVGDSILVCKLLAIVISDYDVIIRSHVFVTRAAGEFQITAQPLSFICMRSLLYNSLLRPLLLCPKRRIFPISLIALSIPLISRQYATFNPLNSIMGGSSSSSANEKYPLEKSDQEWRAILSPEQVSSL